MRDMPWPIMFKWIDKEFPESKFIFTVREEEKWIRSVKNHFGGEKKNSMRKWIYGVSDPLEDEEKYISRYRKHNEEVRDYFKGRFGKDIIEMDITKGDGWSKICSFLEIKEPIFQFPNTNVSTKREIEMGMKEWLLWRMDQIPRKIVKHYRQERLIKSILTWFKSGEIRNAINKGIRKAFYDR